MLMKAQTGGQAIQIHAISMTVSKCMCRFVRTPRLPMILDDHVSTVYHLRTGSADTKIKQHVSDRDEEIIHMACPGLKFGCIYGKYFHVLLQCGTSSSFLQ